RRNCSGPRAIRGDGADGGGMNEHHRELLRELADVGLKPGLRRPARGHVSVERALGGHSYSVFTSTSATEPCPAPYGTAHTPRQLRDAGVYQRRQARSLPRAIAAPALVPFSIEERIEQLELDVVTLLDMLEERPQPQAKPSELFLAPAPKMNGKRGPS